jgi:hypothetical protein
MLAVTKKSAVRPKAEMQTKSRSLFRPLQFSKYSPKPVDDLVSMPLTTTSVERTQVPLHLTEIIFDDDPDAPPAD